MRDKTVTNVAQVTIEVDDMVLSMRAPIRGSEYSTKKERENVLRERITWIVETTLEKALGDQFDTLAKNLETGFTGVHDKYQ